MAKNQSTKPRTQRSTKPSKENPPDMDLGQTDKVLRSSRALDIKRPTTSVQPSETPTHTPGVSSLTPEQKAAVIALLEARPRPSLLEISRRTGAKYNAVKHLAVQAAIETGALASVRLRSYERRLGKRLPVSERVGIYASVARGDVEGSRAADRLRALERIEALEGIVTAREQRESESNQVNVGPLFVLPVAAAPGVDDVLPNARRIQDES